MLNCNPLFLLLLTGLAIPVQASLLPVPETDGSFQLNISNSNPNLIQVAGDRITAINSASGTLSDKRNSKEGAVIFSTAASQPFTLYLETEQGQVLTVHARPEKGAGKTWSLPGKSPRKAAVVRQWEQAQPYENLLVALNRAMLLAQLPTGYQLTVPRRQPLITPAGLSATPEEAWHGEALQIERYRLHNTGAQPQTLREQDFWHDDVRAVMFSGFRTLPAGSFGQVYITRSREGE